MKTKHTLQQGFTLIEMLVIAPIVVLAIGAFLTVIISMTGEVLSSRGANTLAYNVQDALNRIDQDVKLSTTFLATNNITLTAGEAQGYNNDATNFTNVGGTSGTSLILNSLATNDNPTSLTSGLVYQTDKPNACASNRVQDNTPMSINIVYFVKDNTLWRRTIMPSNYAVGTSVYCATPWQQPSCAPGYTAVFCKTNDIKLVEGVGLTGFNVQYFTSASSTSADATASDTAASVTDRGTALQSLPTVGVSITASQNIAGRNVERSATLRSTRLDTNASTIANYVAPTTPSAPTLSGSVSAPTSVVYTWPKVDGADNYTFQYNINGGSWQTPVTNQNVNTYTVTAGTHTNVINGRVTATNSAGTSTYSSTSSITIPLWAKFLFQNGWTDYSPPFTSAGYTKTSSGTVVLKGMVKAGTGAVIGNLPAGYRPVYQLIFENISNSTPGRLDIASNGDITMSSPGSNAWFSLDGISFMPSGASFTNLSLANGWAVYAAPYNIPPGYLIDSSGRVRIQGMIYGGTATSGTAMTSALPVSARPPQYTHFHAMDNSATAHYSIDTAGNILAKGFSNAWLPMHAIYFPSTYGSATTCAVGTTHVDDGWCNLTLQNSWVNYSTPTYSSAQYTRSSDGIVVLKGLIRSGTTTAGTVIATLPAGYRPKEQLLMATQSANSWARLDISTNGQITVQANVSATWLSLDGMHFMSEQ